MDLCDYSRARFDEIEVTFRAFLKSIGVEPGCFIPMSARHGDNIASRGDKMPWWAQSRQCWSAGPVPDDGAPCGTTAPLSESGRLPV